MFSFINFQTLLLLQAVIFKKTAHSGKKNALTCFFTLTFVFKLPVNSFLRIKHCGIILSLRVSYGKQSGTDLGFGVADLGVGAG